MPGPNDYTNRPLTGSGSRIAADKIYVGESFRSPEEAFYSNMSAISGRLEKLERVVPLLDEVVPMIRRLDGFVTFAEPHLALKVDVTDARAEAKKDLADAKEGIIEKVEQRPTTTMIVSLFGILIAILALLAAILAIPYLVDLFSRK